MAATPVYGQQYIRFAETAQVAADKAIPQFSVVKIATAGSTPTIEAGTATGAAFGVIQQDVNLANTGLATDLPRLATVATSGLLLVVAAEDDNKNPAVGEPLSVTTAGVAILSTDAGATAVTVNGTTPVVREIVDLGGVKHALVSFS